MEKSKQNGKEAITTEKEYEKIEIREVGRGYERRILKKGGEKKQRKWKKTNVKR
jgi:hypothetical protein